jgi:hypothetical protein
MIHLGWGRPNVIIRTPRKIDVAGFDGPLRRGKSRNTAE